MGKYLQASERGHGGNNPHHPPPAHGQCERVARERAGGERGFPRAGGAARGQKAECTRAVRPRVQRLPHLMRRSLNAGRRNVKNDMSAYLSRRRRKRGAGKSARAFPRKARRKRLGVRGESWLASAKTQSPALPHLQPAQTTAYHTPPAPVCRKKRRSDQAPAGKFSQRLNGLSRQ
jgi:hypothetical protein